ncbi:transcriptional regulator [Cellulophaga phage Ingeline_1]|uniref:LuxR family transcriptional regulator n=1 Tax=Cellulophaga phage Ingeline_1 TaxID=2745674 RepID=A0A8E4ZBU2_9CAUD|nr:transcriptional regulator [Cellulophaga phage Ingeline_1]QQV90021.1 LuxR family transcriptional regulator [Cellulophaga phage Ingeline_2]QQV90071.1 LuxR family transcriptional regulator [Cellulophaga phage Ingeline_3]QQV90121.1 LuxR family transcriptional regulator [Cellulophaga phage Ingeline_4]QQV90170.1 LuxR family transcriptional regulator [Cellulophaga phage Ingeline_5]QQV90220.1 LuxR family transcriptional regulator [Cellulophaga phage Ingeline_6]QQV90270.1 LuxR family transcriptiona
MQSEITKNTPSTPVTHIFNLPAGLLPNDNSTELFGDRKTGKVYFMTKGKTLAFRYLSKNIKEQLLKKLLADPVASEQLKALPFSVAIERFAYCLYGGLDHTPDINETGVIGLSENFQCLDKGCNCKNWHSKMITYKGHVLSGKKLEVLMAYRKGREASYVAAELGITEPTLNSHKKKLFTIFNVYSTSELVVAAIEAKIIQ